MTHLGAAGALEQRGAVLFTSLILLLILTIIAVTAARLETAEAIMARNEHNHQLAMQSAEAVLRDVETNLIVGIYGQGQFDAGANGFYTLAEEVQGPAGSSFADTVNWDAATGSTAMTYTGPALADVPQSPRAPQVIIESLPPVAGPDDPLCNPSYGQQQAACAVYRVTAHAAGGDSSASATLQSVVR